MREIKFRIWNKKMDYPGFVNTCDGEPIYVSLDGKLCSLRDGFMADEPSYLCEFPEAIISELVIEQYTGLKDKNGVEIYEGDILRCIENPQIGEVKPGKILQPIPKGFKEYITDVIWDEGGFTMKSGGADYDTNIGAWFGYDDPKKNLYPKFTCEVIGNIHENPELLEGK